MSEGTCLRRCSVWQASVCDIPPKGLKMAVAFAGNSTAIQEFQEGSELECLSVCVFFFGAHNAGTISSCWWWFDKLNVQ